MDVKNCVRDGILYLTVEGRLDAQNSALIEKQMFDTVAEAENEDIHGIVIDAQKLDYISSAGLRVLMKLKKSTDKAFSVQNVTRDVYDIFDTTGFTEIFEVKKAYKNVSVDGLDVIGRGFFGTVYRLDSETIIKVYRGSDSIPMIENEKRMAQKAFVNGIPTAISYDIVRVGEDYGSVFELLDAKTYHEMVLNDPGLLEEIVEKYVGLIKLVHGTHMQKGDLPSYKEIYSEYLDVIKEHLSQQQYDRLKKMLNDMPEENTVIHGDIQMKNVMQVGDEPMLIDMETLGLGNPVFELSGLFVTYQEFEEDDPDNSMSFLGMTQEMVDTLWKKIFETYFCGADAAEKENILNSIRLVATIRFLFLMESTDLKCGELGAKRIAHTKEHIADLIDKTDRLDIKRY